MQAGGRGGGDSGASGSATSGGSPHLHPREDERTGKAESPRARGKQSRDPPVHTESSPHPCRPSRNLPISQKSQLRSVRAENQLLITGTQESGLEQGEGPQPVSREPPESLSLQGAAVLRWATRGSGWPVGSAERAPCLAVGRTWGPPWGPPELALASPAWGLGPIQVETQSAGPCSRVTRLLGQKSQPPAGLARNLSRPGGLSFLMSPLRPALCQLPGRQGTSSPPWPALSTGTQS